MGASTFGRKLMPFQQPWDTYSPGDLLFGLVDNRQMLVQHFRIRPTEIYTIDQYDILSDARPVESVKNPLKHDNDFLALLRSNPKTESIIDTELVYEEVWSHHELAVAKRKCKAGLEYIIYKTLYRIHFCLDGMDLKAAANKSYDGSKGGRPDNPVGKTPPSIAWDQKVRSVTGAELRWVYRHRLEPMVCKKIQFWDKRGGDWIQCPPPWSDNLYQPDDVRSAWAGYQPTIAPKR
jgi:hypothetical protein